MQFTFHLICNRKGSNLYSTNCRKVHAFCRFPKTFWVGKLAFLGPPLSLYYWCFWPWPCSDCLLWPGTLQYQAPPWPQWMNTTEIKVLFLLHVFGVGFFLRGGGTCPMAPLLRDLSWWSCHHLEIAGDCSRRMGSKMLLPRWASVHISLITGRHRQCRAGSGWEIIILFYPRK